MSKERTQFGKYFSNLRKERKQTISDAAKALGVSISYISSVEHGDRDIPRDWRGKIISIYNLSENEIKDLENAIFNTSVKLRINIDELERVMRNMVDNLARSEEEKEQMLKVMKIHIDEFRK